MAIDYVVDFSSLLSRSDVTESQIQQHMEQHTELIPLPDLLGHDLAWNSVISQFVVDKSRHPDFAYLTKNTAHWRLVLIELEHPQKPVFRRHKYVDFSSDAHAAIAQIEEWKSYLNRRPSEIRERLRPLLHFSPAFEKNPLDFHYVLIIGRCERGDYTQAQSERVMRLSEESRIELLTYDSILRGGYQYRLGAAKNILAHCRDTYRIKHACADTSLFAYYGPEHIEVPAEAFRWFLQRGYDMHAWKGGELLKLNAQHPWRC